MGFFRAREFSRTAGCLIYVLIFGLLAAQCACSPARPSGGGGPKKNDGSGSPNSNVLRSTQANVLLNPFCPVGPADQLDVSQESIVLSSDSEPEVTEVGRVTNIEVVGSRQQDAAESSVYRARMQEQIWKDSVSALPRLH